MGKYEFTEDMAEISGMGGKYEENCQTMLKAGLEFMDEHKDLNPIIFSYKGVTGIVEPDNKDAEKLYYAVVNSVDDCTGAMIHHVLSHIIWIDRHTWEEWVEKRKERKIERDKEVE